MCLTGRPRVCSVRDACWIGFHVSKKKKKKAAKEKNIDAFNMSEQGSNTCQMKASTKSTGLPLVLSQAEQETKDKQKNASCPRRRCESTAKAGNLNFIKRTTVHLSRRSEIGRGRKCAVITLPMSTQKCKIMINHELKQWLHQIN